MKLQELEGHWALVTGASEGLGREFCLQLAAAGMHLILVARRESLMTELAGQLINRHGIETRVMAADLSNPAEVLALRSRLVEAGIRIRLLVNNAGIGRWGHFENAPLDCYQGMIAVNITAMVCLCHQFLPELSSFPSSAIINVGSPAALQPVPYMAVYAASKAFVHSFSQALFGEWQTKGVLVQTLIPGPTATAFDSKAQAYDSALQERDSPARVIQSALAHLVNDEPLAAIAKGTYKQRLFASLFPSKMVIKQVGQMFLPPESAKP